MEVRARLRARAPRATAFAGFGHGENVIRT